MFLLTLRDLQYRAVRFGIAILGTALVFSMVLIMSGLSAQFRKEPKDTVDALGADTWVVKEGVTGAFTSGVTIPAKLADDLEKAGAEKAGPAIIVRHTAAVDGAPKDIMLFGYELGGLGEPPVLEGAQASARGEVVASKESGLEVGDETSIGGKPFKVTGTTEKMTIFGGTPLLFVDATDAQELVFQGQPVATSIMVKGNVDPPAGFQAMSSADTAEDALRPLKKPVSSIDVVQILLWLVAASIIGAVVYLSALERVRDFAVMKAVGASSRGLLMGLMMQSVLVALSAAIVAAVVEAGLVPLFPIPIVVPPTAYVTLPIIAIVVGALASLGGLRKAVNVDPALAFSGPGG